MTGLAGISSILILWCSNFLMIFHRRGAEIPLRTAEAHLCASAVKLLNNIKLRHYPGIKINLEILSILFIFG